MNQHSRVNKTNFHMKGFAQGLALKQRRKETRLLDSNDPNPNPHMAISVETLKRRPILFGVCVLLFIFSGALIGIRWGRGHLLKKHVLSRALIGHRALIQIFTVNQYE